MAPLDVKLCEDTVYQLRPTHIEGAPDLIIEVLSPATAHLDLWEKRYDYAQAGVQEYWIVDPESQRIELCGKGSSSGCTPARSTGAACTACCCRTSKSIWKRSSGTLKGARSGRPCVQ